MERSPYSFANINFLGKCNLDCDFCLGKDLEDEFNRYNDMDIGIIYLLILLFLIEFLL